MILQPFGGKQVLECILNPASLAPRKRIFQSGERPFPACDMPVWKTLLRINQTSEISVSQVAKNADLYKPRSQASSAPLALHIQGHGTRVSCLRGSWKRTRCSSRSQRRGGLGTESPWTSVDMVLGWDQEGPRHDHFAGSAVVADNI